MSLIMLICIGLFGCSTILNGYEIEGIRFHSNDNGILTFSINDWPEIVFQVSKINIDVSNKTKEEILLEQNKNYNALYFEEENSKYILAYVVPAAPKDGYALVISIALINNDLYILTLTMEAEYFNMDEREKYHEFIRDKIINFDKIIRYY